MQITRFREHLIKEEEKILKNLLEVNSLENLCQNFRCISESLMQFDRIDLANYYIFLAGGTPNAFLEFSPKERFDKFLAAREITLKWLAHHRTYKRILSAPPIANLPYEIDLQIRKIKLNLNSIHHGQFEHFD